VNLGEWLCHFTEEAFSTLNGFVCWQVTRTVLQMFLNPLRQLTALVVPCKPLQKAKYQHLHQEFRAVLLRQVVRIVRPSIWLIEQGLTSPPTQYKLSGRRFYRSKDPTNSIKVLKEKTLSVCLWWWHIVVTRNTSKIISRLISLGFLLILWSHELDWADHTIRFSVYLSYHKARDWLNLVGKN